MPHCARLLGSHLIRSGTTTTVVQLFDIPTASMLVPLRIALKTNKNVTGLSFTCYQRLSGRPVSVCSILFQSVGPRQCQTQAGITKPYAVSFYQSYVRTIRLHQCICIYLCMGMGMRNIRRHVKCCCGVLGFPSPSPHGKEHVTIM
jgi:hypothetical protein